jgi:Nuclease-related domain.
MPYLICEECEVYYEIESNFNSALKTCGKCTAELKYCENFDDYYKKKNIGQNTYSDEMNLNMDSNYDKISTTGFILAVIGLFIFLFTYISPLFFISQNVNFQNSSNLSLILQIISLYLLSLIVMASGVLTYLYGKRNGKIRRTGTKNKKTKKSSMRIKKENSTANYFNNLPEGYFILNNLKIPAKRIKIDHVIVGPTGIFLIHIRNLRGHHLINENTWLDNISKVASKTMINPSQHVKLNAIELKRFLESKNLNMDYMLINSIVAFAHDNFTVRKMPRTYSVMNIREISNFIVNSKLKIDIDTVTRSVLLLEQYSNGISRS